MFFSNHLAAADAADGYALIQQWLFFCRLARRGKLPACDLALHALPLVKRHNGGNGHGHAADLPGGPFGVAVAVQSVHSSSDEGKKRALDAVHAVLAHGGLFLLLDRVRLATPALFGAYRSVWEALGSAFNSQQREGGTLAEHVCSVAERGDKPGSLEQNLLWLREAGFDEVAVLYVIGVRALIAAVVR